MKILHLHLKFEYFDAIKRNEKLFEYRLASKWKEKLDKNKYDVVRLYRGYQSSSSETVIDKKYKGYTLEIRQHKHFGENPVEVCAIDVTETIAVN